MTNDTLKEAITFLAPDSGGDITAFVDACCESFLQHGAIVMNNVYTPNHLDEVNRAYQREYGNMTDSSREVGDKRTMIAIDIKPPFSEPSLFAPEIVMSVLRRLLGEGCILDAYVAVTSRPDSADQHVHVDFPFLFLEDEGLSRSLPPYAITVAIPLIPLNAMTGVTRIWPGTHRGIIGGDATQLDLADAVSVIPQPGGCYLFDARLQHGGTANYSQAERPILYLVYCRPWWRDSTNFYNQKPLIIRPEVLAALPTEFQPIFRYAS